MKLDFEIIEVFYVWEDRNDVIDVNRIFIFSLDFWYFYFYFYVIWFKFGFLYVSWILEVGSNLEMLLVDIFVLFMKFEIILVRRYSIKCIV